MKKWYCTAMLSILLLASSIWGLSSNIAEAESPHSLLNNAITSLGDVTLQPASQVYGNISLNGVLSYYELNGTVTRGVPVWPIVNRMTSWHLPQVDFSHPYPANLIDIKDNPTISNTEPNGWYWSGSTLNISSTMHDATATLNGTLYVDGNVDIGMTNQDYTLNLNNNNIFATGDIDIGGKTTITGSGCIVAMGNVFFLPKMNQSEDDFIFIMSVNGSVLFQPMGNFYGSLAGDVDVDVQPASSIAWTQYPIDPSGDTLLNIPQGNIPIAVDDSVITNEDTPVTINVLGNDLDVTNDTIIEIDQPQHGQATINEDRTVTYLPNVDYNGLDSFIYTIYDTDGYYFSQAEVSIQVNPVNDAPVAVGDFISTDEDTPVTINVLANDYDVDSINLSAVNVSTPGNGTFVVNDDNTITYTPNQNYNGSDSFNYQAYDVELYSNVATVNIIVNKVNDVPAANNDSCSTDEDTLKAISLTATDVDGDSLTYNIVTPPAHGNLSGTAPDVTYTPNANYYGLDSFTFKANDGTVDSNIATVTITVGAVNDAPVAYDEAYYTNKNTALIVNVPGVLGNDCDVEGDLLSATLVSNVSHGTITLNANGSFIYTPSKRYTGKDSFTYYAEDGNASSNLATVIIGVNVDPYMINAPSNLIATFSGSNVTLKWADKSDNEEGFYIECATKTPSGYTAYVRIGQVSVNIKTFQESVASGSYKYHVQAFNLTTGRVSGYSNEATVRVK